MIYYLIALLAGIGAGLLMKSGFMSKSKAMLFNFSLIGLLFFMGVNLGKDKGIAGKLVDFGITSVTISSFTVFFSVAFVWILLRLGGKGQK